MKEWKTFVYYDEFPEIHNGDILHLIINYQK